MPQIYDNSNAQLLDALRNTLGKSQTHSLWIATGYFQLSIWHRLVEGLALSPDFRCALLIGMLHRKEEGEDPAIVSGNGQTPTALTKVLEALRRQLEAGLPDSIAERALRRLHQDLRQGVLTVKAYLCSQALHAKLYLIEREDSITPQVGFLGSSNFTYAGLQTQGELNVDITDQDATHKLKEWFKSYWNQPCAVDISQDLAEAIEKSWAFQTEIHPYHLYLRIAYHLCEPVLRVQKVEIPSIFREKKIEILPHQREAIIQLLYLLKNRKGALLGDVVGLGKTLTAAVVARIFFEERGGKTLVLCPSNLTSMWRHYLATYNIWGDVVSIAEAPSKLRDYPPALLVIIDESHNLRNPEGKRYEAIWNYLRRHTPMPKVLLLSATPYNKHFEDLSAQLKLFLDENEDLGVRPEAFLGEQYKGGKTLRDVQAMLEGAPLTSLRAFMKSHNPADWRNLMRLFLVRRTRSYVQKNYAQADSKGSYLEVGGRRYYFPKRVPSKVLFDPDPITHLLFAEDIVRIISDLHLPRYGLADYILKKPLPACYPTKEEEKILHNLKQARTQLRGFVKASLYKRLESSTYSFLLSILRHMVRNLFLLEAISKGYVLVGKKDVVTLLDSGVSDQAKETDDEEESQLPQEGVEPLLKNLASLSLDDLEREAKGLFEAYQRGLEGKSKESSKARGAPHPHGHRVRVCLFDIEKLRQHLQEDIQSFWKIVQRSKNWSPVQDAKKQTLERMLSEAFKGKKVLIFTQFADTALYLYEELRKDPSIGHEVGLITSYTEDPHEIVRRFSPKSNDGLPEGKTELRVLLSTDVLSEGQNLQDAYIVVNYDLPWAIIRLIQRAGRVDRIGQESSQVYVYSFMPHRDLEKIIQLRQRLIQRLRENHQILGSDEYFFEEREVETKLRALYADRPEVLEEEGQVEEEVDLAAEALAVWRKASPKDREHALALPPMSRTATSHPDMNGMVAYFRFQNGHDSLVYISAQGETQLQSPVEVFRQLKFLSRRSPVCRFTSPENDELLKKCLEAATAPAQVASGGALGTRRSFSWELYEYLRTAEDPLLVEIRQLINKGRPLQDKARRILKPLLKDSNGRAAFADNSILQKLKELYTNDELFHKVESPASVQLLCALRLYPSC